MDRGVATLERDRGQGPAATIGEVLTVPLARPRNRVELAEDPAYMHCRPEVLDFLYTRHGHVEREAA